MMKKSTTNQIAVLVLVFLTVVFFEVFFLKNGNIINLLLGGGLLYYGVKQREKWTVFLGLFFILIALFSLWSLRLVIFGGLVYIIVKLWQGVSADEIIRPIREFRGKTPNGIWKNKLFSIQSTPFSSYEWEDIHIQGLVGDIQVDVTETVLPKKTSLISIRQGIGRVKVELPYEIPVRIHYTTLFGEAKLFNKEKKRLINETLHMQDSYHDDIKNSPELIITIATWAGDVEVVRK